MTGDIDHDGFDILNTGHILPDEDDMYDIGENIGVPSGESVEISMTSFGNTYSLGATSAPGMQFTTVDAFTASKAAFYLKDNLGGASTGDVICNLFATSAGKPTGPVLATSSVDCAGISTTGEWIEFPFVTPVDLSATTMYALTLLSPIGTGTYQAFYLIGNTYPGGVLLTTTDAWTNSTVNAGFELGFKVYSITGMDYTRKAVRDLYLSGDLSDGTDSVTVTEAKEAYDHSLLTSGNPHNVVITGDGVDCYQSNGDGSTYAFTTSDFIADGGWYDLDLSALAPNGATAVIITVVANSGEQDATFRLKPGGHSNNINISTLTTPIIYQDWSNTMVVEMDSLRVIQYSASLCTWSKIDVSITGWLGGQLGQISAPIFMLEQAAADTDVDSYGQLWVKNDAPNTLWFTDDDGGDFPMWSGYVDRGDPALADFYVDDFITTDGLEHDLDLSGIVPAGAKAVSLTIKVQDNATGSYIRFRSNGNTNTISAFLLATQVADVPNYQNAIVALDANRVIEYKCNIRTFTILRVSVVGWWMGY
jgi:hypothetical protein